MFNLNPYFKVQIGTYLSNTFPIQNSLKQGMLDSHCFAPLFSNAIWMDHTNHNGLKLSGAGQLLVHSDNVDIVRGDTYTTKNTEVSLVASKTVCIEVDDEKCYCVL